MDQTEQEQPGMLQREPEHRMATQPELVPHMEQQVLELHKGPQVLVRHRLSEHPKDHQLVVESSMAARRCGTVLVS